jgi:CheY-like chemotaxis protein
MKMSQPAPRKVFVTKPALLIVDDDATLTEHLAELFGMQGYNVTVAPDGLDALRLLSRGAKPDLMLLDMHMQGVNGWDLASELHQLGMKIPILVLTADTDPAACARQIGAAASLAKPFDLPDLVAAVDKQLHEHRGRAA